MIFEIGDLTDVRFCTSPLWETIFGRRALDDPGSFPAHQRWVRWARDLCARGDLANHATLLASFARPGSWLPDFLCPPPQARTAHFADEMATVRATPPERVTADILACARWKPLTPMARATADNPQRMLPVLADAIEAWHDAAIAPHWSRMQALLDADIAHRTRQLASGGLRELFSHLHQTLRWEEDRIITDDPWELTIPLRGRGLPLMPSVFVNRTLWTVSDTSLPCGVYPVRAVGTLWSNLAPGAPDSDALARVLGPARAQLMALLRAPATTTDLARRIGLSVSAVSQHLSALHAAGLLTRQRTGKAVLYEVSDVGAAVLGAASPENWSKVA